MISKEVAQQALDALDWAIAGNKEFGDEPWPEGVAAAEALSKAMEEPEPVVSQQLTAELSDEEIWKFWWNKPEVPDGDDDSMEAQFVAAVRAIEREIRGAK